MPWEVVISADVATVLSRHGAHLADDELAAAGVMASELVAVVEGRVLVSVEFAAAMSVASGVQLWPARAELERWRVVRPVESVSELGYASRIVADGGVAVGVVDRVLVRMERGGVTVLGQLGADGVLRPLLAVDGGDDEV